MTFLVSEVGCAAVRELYTSSDRIHELKTESSQLLHHRDNSAVTRERKREKERESDGYKFILLQQQWITVTSRVKCGTVDLTIGH